MNFAEWLTTTQEGQHCWTMAVKHGLDLDILQIVYLAGQFAGLKEAREALNIEAAKVA
jgi:hypothetical protein